MEKLIADQLEIYFKDYKEYMLWILAIFFLLIIIIQFISNLLLSKKIEQFKNDLKKTEIKFSRHSELQIECLKNMYDKVVNFHFTFNSLINPSFLTHDTLKSNINQFNHTYNENLDYFHRNKILLTDDIINQIGILHTQMNIVRSKFQEQYNSLEEYEEYMGTNDPQALYNTAENEVDSIRKKIEETKKVTEIANFESEIKKLREKIEAYFKELTG